MTREDLLRQMIDDYRKKIGTYEAMIREWETELGAQSPAHSASAAPGTGRKADSGADTLALVNGMQFFNKSQPEAARMFLELVGYPLRTNQIVEGIEKGGVTIGGKTAQAKKTNLYTILHRGDDFGLVRKDTWGLTSWPGVKKEKEAKPEGAPPENTAEATK